MLSFFSLDDVWLASRCASELHSPFAQKFESCFWCMQNCRIQPTLYVSSVRERVCVSCGASYCSHRGPCGATRTSSSRSLAPGDYEQHKRAAVRPARPSRPPCGLRLTTHSHAQTAAREVCERLCVTLCLRIFIFIIICMVTCRLGLFPVEGVHGGYYHILK